MRRSYLDYAMSVIVARALPDVRDGLKPVHRRILYAMKEGGYDWSRPYRKSARIVGDVMGKYHPHGDVAIYDAMVRMAQDFSMRLTLIDGQGNFGSMDGDPPAAMRYTEARLARSAEPLLRDIDKETVDFQPNYDDSDREPSVLPAEFPNLLVNGAGGIAVGMATNIPTHNLGEVIDACCAVIDDPGISVEALMQVIPGPDFPTGAILLGKAGILEAFRSGRGSLILRARSHVEDIRKDRRAIVVTEIPFQVNKAKLQERIGELVNDKVLEGIADVRDESDRDGVRVVIELKRDADPDVVLAQLHRYTTLQTSFGVNMLALNGGRPMQMGLKDVLEAFIAFRQQVITRRTVYELRKARERAHVLAGLLVAITNIDAVIQLIRTAADPGEARDKLCSTPWPAAEVADFIRIIDDPGHQVVDGHYRLSETQARAILDLRLHRLTGLERDRLVEETREIARRIGEYLEILASRERLMAVLRDELLAVKAQFATPRRTVIEDGEIDTDIEDLIQREDMVVTVSHGGYIKRTPLSTYRAQRRGGKGRAGMATREEDFVADMFVADTHRPMLFFTSRGMVYQLKVYRLPLGNPQSRGKAMVNLLPLTAGETISTVMPLPADKESWEALHVMFATAGGTVRRNLLSDFTNIKANGKIAMKLGDGDRLVAVAPCQEDQDVLLVTKGGRCIRFPVPEVRLFTGRDSVGVRGIRLADGDAVISMSLLRHVEGTPEERAIYLRKASALRRAIDDDIEPVAPEEGEEVLPEDAALDDESFDERFQQLAMLEEFILTVTEKGYGKRSSSFEYRVTGRGGQGIGAIEMSDRNGAVVASFPVSDADQIMLVTDGGQLIRCPVNDIRIAGRRTQGVTLFRVEDGERVVSVAHLAEAEAGGENGDNGGQGDAP
ncbi:MAG: DNA gyrase subunit A [Thalassobaculales bacterium]